MVIADKAEKHDKEMAFEGLRIYLDDRAYMMLDKAEIDYDFGGFITRNGRMSSCG